MKNMDINKLKRPVKYGKIPLELLNNKEYCNKQIN